MIRWKQHNGTVYTFDSWRQLINEVKTWGDFEFEDTPEENEGLER